MKQSCVTYADHYYRIFLRVYTLLQHLAANKLSCYVVLFGKKKSGRRNAALAKTLEAFLC